MMLVSILISRLSMVSSDCLVLQKWLRDRQLLSSECMSSHRPAIRGR